MALEDEALRARFEALTAVLQDGAFFWSTRPFLHRRVAWEDELPALSAWVRSLPPEAVYALEADPFQAAAPEPWRSFAARIEPLLTLEPLGAQPVVRTPRPRQVKDRKWDQVEGFLDAVLAQNPGGTSVVEWCAGRGHLGRTLARRLHTTALLLERNPELCRPAADGEPDPAHHATVDVFDDDALAGLLPGDALHVSLHACGTLTDRVLHHACAHHGAIVSAPCCFHRIPVGTEAYQPASTTGRASGVRLERPDLRLATREACHASPRHTHLRARELVARAGWDLLRREASGDDVHHGFPRQVRANFDQPFDALLRALSDELGAPLPAFDAEPAERAAQARVLEIRALDLPRMLFRRAIELWVDLDRACSLQERGLRTRVGTFCAIDATPRNIAIVAHHP